MPLDTCPECGRSLDGMSSEELKAHREDHWDARNFDPRVHQEGIRRHDALEREELDRRIAERRAEDADYSRKQGY